MNDIKWTKFIVETFLGALGDYCLDEELRKDIDDVTRARAKHIVRSELAVKLGMSLKTLDNRIKLARSYYDLIQSDRPELGLPIRKPSKEEDYMDSH